MEMAPLQKVFTLVELFIVIVIVGMLATVAVPSYKRYVRQSMSAEGEALVMAVAQAERLYYVDYKTFTANTSLLGVNGSTNKYFKSYMVRNMSGPWDILTTGDTATAASGITVAGRFTTTTPLQI